MANGGSTAVPKALIISVAVMLLGTLSVGAARGAAPPGLGSRLLSANLLGGLGRLRSVGADESAPMVVGVALARPDPAGEQALYQSLYAPGSPNYRQFLTPAEFDGRFGVSPVTYARTVGWLRSAGLSVDTSTASHDYVLASGSVKQVQRAFATTVRSFRLGTSSFLANVTAPSVPRDLPVLSVVGLNTFQRFSVPARPAASPMSRLPNVFATSPQALWSIYDQPNAYRGGGQRIAVFGSGASAGAVSDLAQFEKINHLRKVPVTVHNVGPGKFKDQSGQVEWDIDTQASSGMAPDLSGLTLYFASDLIDARVQGLLSRWVNDPAGPAQANASFGECERTVLDPTLEQLPGNVSQDPNGTAGVALGNNLEPVAEQTLRQGTIEGRTLFSSTGDTGSSCPVVVVPILGPGNGAVNQVLPLTSYPASSQYAVAVGGTVLYTNGTKPDTRALEYAWTFGGGGDSLLIDAPSYQRGTPGLSLPCVATPKGELSNLGRACRGIPDVAAQSGDVLTNGYAIVSNGVVGQGGGTSLSSPLWAGMWARVNQSAGHRGAGFANETLYRLGKNPVTRARDFFDITIGVNGIYSAGPGWDYVSGFGTPRLAHIISDTRSEVHAHSNLAP